MGCVYYGKNGMFGTLIPQGGNQCGMVINAHSPCAMEIQGLIPEWTNCIYFNEEVTVLMSNEEVAAQQAEKAKEPVCCECGANEAAAKLKICPNCSKHVCAYCYEDEHSCDEEGEDLVLA